MGQASGVGCLQVAESVTGLAPSGLLMSSRLEDTDKSTGVAERRAAGHRTMEVIEQLVTSRNGNLRRFIEMWTEVEFIGVFVTVVGNGSQLAYLCIWQKFLCVYESRR
jgi:hypothetical protein